ncbi:MAG: MipA/OmpV family protein [Phyllobacterium sp.]
MRIRSLGAVSGAFFMLVASAATAADYGNDSYGDTTATTSSSNGGRQPWSGNWYLKIGAVGMLAPKYEGAKDYMFKATPTISIGKAGDPVIFSSRNDSASFGFIDTGVFRAGIAGRLIWGRDADDSDDLKGLDDVKFGGELGGFADIYATDNIRIRGELRRGIRSHNGYVADIAVDAFKDVTPYMRLSGGPRITIASEDYMDTFFGVSASESRRSGLRQYSPKGGVKSVGAGGAITWKVTEKMDASVFAEYNRLVGEAADSSLVKQRGSANQISVGVSASYTFDFSM